MAESPSGKRNSELRAVVFALIMTLPVLGVIFDGFDLHRIWIAGFGIGLYVIMLCFYVVTAHLVLGHAE